MKKDLNCAKSPYSLFSKLLLSNGNSLLRQEATTPGGKKVQLLSLPYFLAGQVERYAAWLMGEGTTR